MNGRNREAVKMKCPVCGVENRAGVIVCESCHNDLYTALLEQVSTKQLDKNRERILQMDATMPSSNPIVIYIRNAPEPLAIPRSGTVIFGRQDETGQEAMPDIDLGEFDADDLGVSRLHLELDTEAMPPTITDLNSYNGSFINGQKLAPHKTYSVQSSDEIRLGRIVLRLFYDH
jgi:hypothetical protein